MRAGMSEPRTDGFWSAEAREAATAACQSIPADDAFADDYADAVCSALQPFVERMIEDERARAGQIMDRALADVQKASEDVQADLDAAASLARQAASDRARDCAAAEDVIRRRGIELGRLDAAGRKLAEAGDALALEVEKVEHRTDLTGAHRRWHECRAASPWGDER